MKNTLKTLAPRGRMVRWAVGITLAGFLAGGGFAVAVAATGNASAATSTASSQASNQDLSALLSASGTAGTSGTAVTSGTAAAKHGRLGPLRRLRRIGGMYGNFTYQTKDGDRTLAFERGTIESVTSSGIVVQAADGTTMTWLFESSTVVRDHGKATTSTLSDGQLVFVGGPVVSGAKDARLIVIRSPKATSPTQTPASSSSTSVS
jgi:hypothetical protein